MSSLKNFFQVVAVLIILQPSVNILSAGNVKRTTQPLKVFQPPIIDGVLDEESWMDAPLLTDFIQFEPDKGKPATVITELRVMYDERFLYFGFQCRDPNLEKIVLGTERDRLYAGTDSVDILLDTFYDQRTGYYFRTNPLGVQHDGTVSNNGMVADTSWDGAWLSAGSRNPQGWSAEMAIPFSTLKHQTGDNQTWGFQASRYLPRNLEKSFWTGPLEDYRKMDGNGTLTGIDISAKAGKLQIIPHLLARFEEDAEDNWEAGLDARYDFSSSLSGHLTVNPDFATVEADQEQVNLTRFELNLREKRNFFMEGNASHDQPIRLFYSRRVSEIYGGAKLYGRICGSEVSILTAQTREDEYSGLDSANYTVFRIKKGILNNSFLGFTSANRMVNGRGRGAAGIDSSLFLSSTFSIVSQLAAGYGDAAENDLAFFIRPSHDTSTFHAHLSYSYLGENFGDNVNAVGYIQDDNRNELDSAIQKIFWSEGSFLERIEYDSNYNVYWGMDRDLRSWNVDHGLGFDLRNKLSFMVRHQEEFKLYEKEFRNRQSLIQAGYNTREWQSASVSWTTGRNFDSDFNLIGAEFRRRLNEDFSLEYGLSRLALDPDPGSESTWIHSLKATQYFTRDLFVKIYLQTNSAIDKRNLQAIFAWRFQPPFGQLQLAYQRGSNRFGVGGNQSDLLFLKLALVL